MKKLMAIALFVTGVFAANTSHALFELRLSGSYHIVSPTDFNDFLTQTSGLSALNLDEVTGLPTIGGDAILYLPMVPVGLGLRYEWLGSPEITDADTNTSVSFGLSRASLLANYRVLDSFLWVGPIASLGLIHTFDFDYSSDVTPNYTVDDFNAFSFSIGAEGGVSLGLFDLGAEIGYMHWNYTGLKAEGGGDAAFDTLDLGGIYAKVHLGVGF